MKTNATVTGALVILCFAGLALHAQQSSPTAYTHLEKASKLIGMHVTDSRNQRVGKVYDVAIDMDAGRAAEILIDTKGAITSKQRIVAVPAQSFTFGPSGSDLRMDADIDAFDNAPEFNRTLWGDMTASASVTDVYQRFHARPYTPVGFLEPAEKVLGMAARDQKNNKLGKVEDVIIDLPSGRIPELIIAARGELTAVPPAAFLLEPSQDALLLDTSRNALHSAPHVKMNDWRNGALITLDPNAAKFPALHPAPSKSPVVAPTEQSEMASDDAITLKIQQKIFLTQGLSLDARNVVVTTKHGRVILRGIVDSTKEKEQMGAIAASVVPADHVDNQIIVKLVAELD